VAAGLPPVLLPRIGTDGGLPPVLLPRIGTDRPDGAVTVTVTVGAQAHMLLALCVSSPLLALYLPLFLHYNSSSAPDFPEESVKIRSTST
jgi:hypothetical protein